MTPEQKAKVTQAYKLGIRSKVEDIVRNACGIYGGENFKRGVPLYELISYKVDKDYYVDNATKERKKMEYWLDAIDTIIIQIASFYPFIDLEGITQEWNTEQIIAQTLKMFEEAGSKTITFDGTIPDEKDNTAVFARIEELFKEALGLLPSQKVKKTEKLSTIVSEQMGPAQPGNDRRKEYSDKLDIANDFLKMKLKEEFPEGDWDNLAMYGWNSINDLIKHYKKSNTY